MLHALASKQLPLQVGPSSSAVETPTSGVLVRGASDCGATDSQLCKPLHTHCVRIKARNWLSIY